MDVYNYDGSPAAVIGSSYTQTKNILEALAAYAHSRKPQNLGEYTEPLELEDLHRIIDVNTETGAKDYWLAVAANLHSSLHDDTPFAAGQTSFAKIISQDSAEADLPALEDLYWTKSGDPRRGQVKLKGAIKLPAFFSNNVGPVQGRRNSSAAAEQPQSGYQGAGSSDSEDSEEDELDSKGEGDDGMDKDSDDEELGGGVEESAERPPAEVCPTKPLPSLASRITPRQSEASNKHVAFAKAAASPSARKRAASPTPLAKSRRASPPKSGGSFHSSPHHHRPLDGDGSLIHGDSDSDDDHEPHQSVSADNPVFAEADAAVDAIFAQQTVEAYDNVPPEAMATKSAADAFGRRKAGKKGAAKVKLFLDSFTELRLPYDVKEAVYDNKFWQLDEGNAFSFNSPSAIALPAGIEGLFVAAPSQSSLIRTPLEWDDAFAEVSKLVVRLYPNRREELERYRRHFLAFVPQDESSFSVYYSIDQEFRKHLGQAGYGWTLDDAPSRYSFLLSNHTLQALSRAASSPSKSSTSPKKPKGSSSSSKDAPCTRWNNEKDPEKRKADIPECRDPSKGGPICKRRHVCSSCGGEHRAILCPTRRGGGGGEGGGKGAGGEVGGERGRTDGAPPFALRK